MDSLYEARPWLKNYPGHVPRDLEIGSETALGDFKASAARKPDAPAVYYFDDVITYGDIDRQSDRLAAVFNDLGLKKGDRIIVDLQNVPQFLIATYAAWKLGAIGVPLNPMYKENELLYFCRDSGARLLFTLDEIAAGLDLSFLKQTSIKNVITTSALDMLSSHNKPPGLLSGTERISVPGVLKLQDILRKIKNKTVCDPELAPDDVAYLTYTSGTTGPPKGAMNTHGNIAFNARVYQAMLCRGFRRKFYCLHEFKSGRQEWLFAIAMAGIIIGLIYFEFIRG